MLLISKDKFFVTGILALVDENSFSNIHELMILDCMPFIYVLNTNWFYCQRFEDPLTTILCCNSFLYRKNIKMNKLIKIVRGIHKKNKNYTLERITESELKVVNSLYNGDTQKIIASRFGRSEKTINSHKMAVLHKLGLNNLSMLYNLLHFWETVYPVLNKIKDVQSLYFYDEKSLYYDFDF
ncbi:helix-turn-helix transcriptional regulator [Salmonella enterica]|nr:helix-turn-helix transcriptional regulator [Salmonella enterica]